MKVGIFGDSFAHPRPDNPTRSWPGILSEKYQVTNYSQPGSSLCYSFDLFLDNHQKFDKVIFIVTDPGRIVLPLYDDKRKFIPNYHNAVALKEVHKNDAAYLKTLDAVIDYFLHVQNEKYDKRIHDLMVSEIPKVRPDVILIKGFGSNDTVPSLFQIQLKEEAAWGYKPHMASFSDIRHCHLTEENNIILAEKIDTWLHGEPVNINVDDFVTPMNKEFYLR